MNKLMIAMAVAALVSGCGTMRSALNPLPTFQASIKGTHLDVSTGDETALIVGVNKFWTDCTIRGPVPVKPGDGTLYTPLSDPNSLVVDAGPATIEVACTQTDIFNDPYRYKARFKFAAEAGHTHTPLEGQQIAWNCWTQPQAEESLRANHIILAFITTCPPATTRPK